MTVPAIPTGVVGLANGGVSLTFHVPYENADTAFSVHKMRGTTIRLEIYSEDE